MRQYAAFVKNKNKNGYPPVGGRGASAAGESCGGGSGEQRQVRVIGTPASC